MSKRTILLITESTLGRFDLSGGAAPTVTESWVRPSFASQSAGTLADAAFRLGKSRKRQVFVLTARCWTGSVNVEPDLIAGTSGDKLTETLALEAETYSGISAFESKSVCLPLPPDSLGDQRFWLTQVPDQDLRSIDDAIRQAGAKLLGVAHPAVLKIDVSSTPTEEWRSLQNWDESTLVLRGVGEAIADFHSMSAGLQSQRTIQEFETFFQNSQSTEPLQWIGPGQFPRALAELGHAVERRQFDTTSESDLNRWAAAWMRSHGKQSAGTPLVTIPKRPMSREGGIAVAALLGLLAIGACFAHYMIVKRQFDDVDANVASMRSQQDKLKGDQDRLKLLRGKIDEDQKLNESLIVQTRQTQADVIAVKQIVARSDKRWLSLLDSLIEVSDDDGWVREIQASNGNAFVRGLAIDDAAVHRFAARLESTPAAGQWQILPATTSMDEDTTLTDFSIELVAIGNRDYAESDPDAAPRRRRRRK
ncbi:MAG: hypothetical protein AAFU85_08055 [Planctomycetota bacterium]